MRGEQGLSQTALALRAGVSRHTIMRAEKGVASLLRWDTASRIARALGVAPEALMRDLPAPAEPIEVRHE